MKDKEKQTRARKYDAAVTCTNCGISGEVRVSKGTTIKDAITEGLKCPHCDCAKLKSNTPRERAIP